VRGDGDRRGSKAYFKAAGMAVFFWIICPAAVAQKVPPTAGVDPFITAIETARRSVGSLDCMAVDGAEAKILERIGSAFLISATGDFLTAAHVVKDMQKGDRHCPTPAITLPAGDWRPEARTEAMLWFPFKILACKMDSTLDIAICPLSGDLAARRSELRLKAAPVQFEWSIPPDGTQVAFTGFPLRARDPMTFRANVAAYRIPWPDEPTPELILDHAALPGFSGSPVYLANGKIAAILVKDGKDETTGITIARPASAFREMLAKKP